MKTAFWRVAAISACFTLALASAASADDKVVKIGILNDMSGLFADWGGANSVIAAKMAVEDSGLLAKGWKIEILSEDHQNKPDVAASMARRMLDRDKVDVIADTPNSGVALVVSQTVQQANAVHLNSSAASADLTGKSCTPNTVSFTYDTYMLTHAVGKAMTRTGGDSWFFLTADYAFGIAMERDMTGAVAQGGGKSIGAVRHPINTSDFSSFLLQAQASRAKVIALANAGADTTNAIKQAAEFGISQHGQTLVASFLTIADINTLGLQTAQGVNLTESFYWDLNDQTRAWSKRFAKLSRKQAMPTMMVAGVYASVLHYLKALDALGGNPHDGAKVVAAMKQLPTDDPLFGKGPLRNDGRRLIPAYVFQVKSPAESKYPWDYYRLVATIAPDDAARPLNESECALAKQAPRPVAFAAPVQPQPSATPVIGQQVPKPVPSPVIVQEPPKAVATAAPPPVVGAPAPGPVVSPPGRRVALVIGNGAYKHVSALPNPINDAADMSAAFTRLGFSVKSLRNADYNTMRVALFEFTRQAAGADIGVIYFAGHGIQMGGDNWVIPVDAQLASDLDVANEAFGLQSLIQDVSRTKKLGLVILDACRNNPFVPKMQSTNVTRAVDRGFSRVEPADNVMVAYAARDGTTANDGSGRNSPFTRALLDNIEKPGLEVNYLFRNVRDDVLNATNRQQQPYVYGSLSKEMIYLKAP